MYSQNILIADEGFKKLPKLLNFLKEENFEISLNHDSDMVCQWLKSNPFGFAFLSKSIYKEIPKKINCNIILLLDSNEHKVNSDLRIVDHLKKNDHLNENIFSFIVRRNERNKVTEEVLQTIDDSEIRFKQLFENAPIPIWEENFSHVLEYLNNLKKKKVSNLKNYIDKHPDLIDRLLGLVEITDANVAVMSYFNALTRSDFAEKMRPIYLDNKTENFKNFIISIYDGLKSYSKNTFIHVENSSPKFVHLTWSLVNEYDDEYARVFISLVDLTERKAFEDALRASEINLKHLYHNSPVMMFSLTENGYLTSLNEQWLKTIGIFRDEAINQPFVNYLFEDDKDRMDFILSQDIWRKKVIENISFRMLNSKGEIIHCQMDSVVSTDPNGNKIVLNVAQDITDRVRLEAINEENDRLRNAVNQFANSLIGKNTIDEILWDISENCVKFLDFEDCVIYIMDENGEYLSQKAGFENKADVIKRHLINPLKIRVGDGVTGKAAKTKSSVRIDDLTKFKNYIVDDAARMSEMCVPIIYEGQVLGVIDSENSKKSFFTENHQSALESISNIAAVKIMKALAEEENLKQQEYFYSMINDTEDSIALLNTKYEFLELNDAMRYNFKSLYGLDLERSSNLIKVLSKVNQEYALKWKERFDWALNGEKYFVEEKYTIRKQDVFFEVAFNPVYDNGHITSVVMVARNITDRKKTEQKIRENEALLSLFFTQSIDGFFFATMEDIKIRIKANDQIDFIVDMFLHDLKFTKVNQAMLNQYSAAVEDFIDNPISVLFNNDESAARKFLVSLLKKKHHHLITKTTKLRSREEIWIEGDYICMFNEDNEFTGFFGVQKDITEKIKSENEKKQLEEQIQHTQKLESLGVLAGGIAHDFNNILTSIMGSASFADAHVKNDKIVSEMLSDIQTGSERAAELCRQMLAYSGKGKFVIKQASLPHIVKGMASLLDISISKKVKLIKEFDKKTSAIEGDLTQIRQVIMNLITNASEAIGDKAGKIYVRTGNCTVTKTELLDMLLGEYLQAGKYVYFEVEDTGSGIDEEFRSRIFDPFFTTKFTGRGLGMSAVLGIVKGHNGAIKLDSELGKGSTFRIILPCVDHEIEESKKVDDQLITENWLTSGRVLIADDEKAILKIAERMLEKVGYKVVSCENGKEALDIYTKNNDFDLIILDITMPELNGVDLYKLLREKNSEIPIVLASGYNEQIVSNHITSDDNLYFIQKPFNSNRLISLLKQFN